MHLLELINTFSNASVQFSCSVMSNSLRPRELQHARLPCPSPTPGVHPNSIDYKVSVHVHTHTYTHVIHQFYIYIYIIFLHIRNEQLEIEILKPVSFKIDHPRASLVAQW